MELCMSILMTLFFSFTFYLKLFFDIDTVVVLNRTIPIRYIEESLRNSVMYDKGSGCEIPMLDPFSSEVMVFDEVHPRIVCSGYDWVECNADCHVIEDIFKHQNNVTCEYRDIIYVNDHKYEIGEPVKRSNKERYPLEKSDHVKVSCHAEDSSGKISRWSGNKAGFRTLTPSTEGTFSKPTNHALNVIIIGFESTSKNGFIRKMPKSYKYLTEKIGAVIMNGYNSVGNGSPWSLFPILTGKTELELPDSRKFFFKRDTFLDDRVFLFKILKKHGYRTAFFEDSKWVGTFQNRFNGFKNMPADHYMRSFFMEESGPWWHLKKKTHCVGAIPQYALMLNLTKKFLALDGKHFGVTMISDLTHEDFNLISTADEDFVAFLDDFRYKHLLDTMLIVMGTHETRYQPISETYQGRLEERLPLMAVALPTRLRKRRALSLQCLKYNAGVLTTPFDVHATILSVLMLSKYSSSYAVPGADILRGISFLSPIPRSRSCGEAGVLPQWCACARWTNVSSSDPRYLDVAHLMVDFINSITKSSRSKCAKRRLVRVEWVMRQDVNDQLMKYKGTKDHDGYLANFDTKPVVKPSSEVYQLKVVLEPGRAHFEGSLKYFTNDSFFAISESDISRSNEIGNEADCISKSNPNLKKFCYCINNLH